MLRFFLLCSTALLRAPPTRWSCNRRALKFWIIPSAPSLNIYFNLHRFCSHIFIPEDPEVDKGDDDHVEPTDEDVEESGGMVGWQVDVRAGVQEVGVVFPHLKHHYDDGDFVPVSWVYWEAKK